jgi:hypothetical protein
LTSCGNWLECVHHTSSTTAKPTSKAAGRSIYGKSKRRHCTSTSADTVRTTAAGGSNRNRTSSTADTTARAAAGRRNLHHTSSAGETISRRAAGRRYCYINGRTTDTTRAAARGGSFIHHNIRADPISAERQPTQQGLTNTTVAELNTTQPEQQQERFGLIL